MFPGRQAWLVLNQHTAESLLVCIASTTADYCPCISLIKIDSAYKIYYHSCVVLNHARKGYFRIVPEWVIAQCMLTNFAGNFWMINCGNSLCSQLLYQNQHIVSIIPKDSPQTLEILPIANVLAMSITINPQIMIDCPFYQILVLILHLNYEPSYCMWMFHNILSVSKWPCLLNEVQKFTFERILCGCGVDPCWHL